MIIGNGEQYQELMDLIKNLNLENKVTIKKSVPNDQIQNYYKSAKIFALAYNPELEALPIPVIEAMATGLPIIIPHPKEGFSEGLEGIAIFSKNDEKSFEKNIKTILDNKNLQEEISKKSLQKSKEFDESKIEAREAQIYAELIKKRKNNEEID
jgi:glycosyltransferase involved in cell wall biosynthesis